VDFPCLFAIRNRHREVHGIPVRTPGFTVYCNLYFKLSAESRVTFVTLAA